MVSATINENAKRIKYKQLAADERCKLFPLAFESYGGWGTQAPFFNEVASLVVDRSYGGYVSRGEFLSNARRAVAVAIVRGNGRLVTTAVKLATRREFRRVHTAASRVAADSTSSAHTNAL
jgi:hypothetical protein